MATLRKRGKRYFVDYRLGGKRVRKHVGRDRKLAEIGLKDIEVRIARKDSGLLVRDCEIDKFFQEYLEYSTTNHSPGTCKRYRAIIDHWKRFLNERPWITKLSELSPKFFEDYKTYRRNMPVARNGRPVEIDNGASQVNNGSVKIGAKANTVNMELGTFRTILNMAIRWGYLNENPR